MLASSAFHTARPTTFHYLWLFCGILSTVISTQSEWRRQEERCALERYSQTFPGNFWAWASSSSRMDGAKCAISIYFYHYFSSLSETSRADKARSIFVWRTRPLRDSGQITPFPGTFLNPTTEASGSHVCRPDCWHAEACAIANILT